MLKRFLAIVWNSIHPHRKAEWSVFVKSFIGLKIGLNNLD